MAGEPTYIILNFDNHINKVVGDFAGGEWTTSGQIKQVYAVYDTIITFAVTLDSGYVLDTVTLEDDFSEATLSDKTDTSFVLSIDAAIGSTFIITLTSKLGGSSMSKSVDLTTLSGYESLPAGTYQLGVKAKASGYTDSNLSSTVSFTKLAAPVVTADGTTVSWDAITNAESYDVYVDGELYENTTGGDSNDN